MDFKSSEDDDQLVKGVAQDELALGFFGYAYLYKNAGKLKALAVDDENPSDGAGAVLPSPDTVRSGVYQPLSRPLFIYVSKSALARREVSLFVGFYLSKAASFVSRVGYVPLPDKAYQLAQQRVAARRTGSLFGNRGSQVGVSIEQLLAREEPAASVSSN
jgi:phosphate transport system substrate-binding protein